METEIKNVIEKMADDLVKGIGGHVSGEGNETVEEIRSRNVNIALLKINSILKPLLTKKGNEKYR